MKSPHLKVGGRKREVARNGPKCIPVHVLSHFPSFGNILWNLEIFETFDFCQDFDTGCATKGESWDLKFVKNTGPKCMKNAERTLRTPQNTFPYTFSTISHHLETFCEGPKISKLFIFLIILTKDLRPKVTKNYFFSDHFFTFLDHFFDQSVAFWGVLEFFLVGPRGFS